MKTAVMQFGFYSMLTVPTTDPWITAIHCEDEQHNVVLLLDMQSSNHGASLTNCAEKAIHHVANKLPGAMEAVWVELDSEGCFDLLETNIGHGMPANQVTVGFKPLQVGQHHRTLDGFLEIFQEVGYQAWSAARDVMPVSQKRSSPRHST